MSLPSPTVILCSLVETLSKYNFGGLDDASVNPFADLPSNARAIVLSLHALFPDNFLPALDLLDRRLVTKFILNSGQADSILSDDQNLETELNDSRNGTERSCVFFVRSATTSRGRSSINTYSTIDGKHYEVRVDAWNCSCPAFIFSCFASLNHGLRSSARDTERQSKMDEPVLDFAREIPDSEAESDKSDTGSEQESILDPGWEWGGLRLPHATPSIIAGSHIPICKHLLACILAERCKSLFGTRVEERHIDPAEMAGWAAGWGD